VGADAVEVDVRMAPDGVLRISHDKKTTTAQYSKHPSLTDVFSILQGTTVSVNCDVKEREHIYEILRIASRYGFDEDRIILSGSISPEQVAYDPSILDRAKIYMNIEEILKYLYIYRGSARIENFSQLMIDPWVFVRSEMKHFDSLIAEVIDLVHQLGIKTINFPYRYIEENHCRMLGDEDLFVSVWTVDDPCALQRIIDYSLSNIENVTTRNVHIGKDLLTSSRYCTTISS
jgi:hypothetical protein